MKLSMFYLFNFSFRKVGMYTLGGGLNFLLKMLLTIFLTEAIKIPYFVSYIITLTTIVMFGFFYNSYLTFKAGEDKLRNFIKYVCVLLSFNIIDASVVRILTEFFGIYYVASIIAVTTILSILKYIAYDKVVFLRKEV